MKSIQKIYCISCLFLLLFLSACNNYVERKKTTPKVTVNQEEIQVSKQFMHQLQADSSKKMMVIKTKYGKVYYPKRWQRSLRIQQTNVEKAVCLSFYSVFSNQEYLLFQLTISDKSGDTIGMVKDSHGKAHHVFVDINYLTNPETLSKAQCDQIDAMQDDVNQLLEHLSK